MLQDNSQVVCSDNLQNAASILRISFLHFIEHAKTYDTIATSSFNTKTDHEGQHMNSSNSNNKLMLNLHKRSYWLTTIADEAKTASSLSLAKILNFS